MSYKYNPFTQELDKVKGIGELDAGYLRLDGTNVPTADYSWTTNFLTTGTLGAGAITGTSVTTGLTTDLGVYTTTGGLLTTTPPSSGTLGYWSRAGTVISTATAGDSVVATGNSNEFGQTVIDTTGLYDSTSFTIQKTSDNRSTGFLFKHAGDTPSYTNYFSAWASRGTLASPTISRGGDPLFRITVSGYEPSSFRTTASIDFMAGSTWGAADYSQSIDFLTAKTGETSRTSRFKIDEDGDIKIPIDDEKLCFGAAGATDSHIQYTGSLLDMYAVGGYHLEDAAGDYVNILGGSYGLEVYTSNDPRTAIVGSNNSTSNTGTLGSNNGVEGTVGSAGSGYYGGAFSHTNGGYAQFAGDNEVGYLYDSTRSLYFMDSSYGIYLTIPTDAYAWYSYAANGEYVVLHDGANVLANFAAHGNNVLLATNLYSVLASGEIIIMADNKKLSLGAAGSTDSYLQFGGTNLEYYTSGYHDFLANDIRTSGDLYLDQFFAGGSVYATGYAFEGQSGSVTRAHITTGGRAGGGAVKIQYNSGTAADKTGGEHAFRIDGIEAFGIDSSGNSEFAGNVGIGIAPSYPLHVQKTLDPSTDSIMNYFKLTTSGVGSVSIANATAYTVTDNATSGTQYQVNGMSASVTKWGDALTSNVVGASYSISSKAGATGNVTNATGVLCSTDIGNTNTATFTNVRNYWASSMNAGDGTITSGYNFYGSDPTVNTGTFTKFAHVWLEDASAADTNYGIVLDSDDNGIHFGLSQDAYIKFDGDSMNIVANAVTGTDTARIIGGSILLNPTGAGAVNLFSEKDFGAAEDTPKLSILRNSTADGNSYYDQHIDQYRITRFVASHDFRIQSVAGDLWMDATAGVVKLQDGAQGDLQIFGSSASGENRTVHQAGYITAAGDEVNIEWTVKDTDDYFWLERENANMLGFKIDMPLDLIDNAITTTGIGTFGGATSGQSIIDSGLVVNEGGYGADATSDLRVETISQASAFLIDTSADQALLAVILKANAGLNTIVSTDDVTDPPTDAELDTAFGTPATVGAGFVGILDDNSDDTDVWLCYTSDTSWFYLQGTKAV